jgi:IS5 family transposase
MKHALVKLSRAIDWGFLEQTFGAVYTDKPGQPPLPTRLMAGLAILKHSYDLSDEALCDRWVENPYFQYFCGEAFFQHALVFDRSSLTRWRQRMGQEKLKALLQESLAGATRTDAMKPSDLACFRPTPSCSIGRASGWCGWLNRERTKPPPPRASARGRREQSLPSTCRSRPRTSRRCLRSRRQARGRAQRHQGLG